MAVSAAGLAISGCATMRMEVGGREHPQQEAEVTPGEDLMQEHGVLERILLVYDEAARRIESGQKLDVDDLASFTPPRSSLRAGE
jgi:hypothetical protein